MVGAPAQASTYTWPVLKVVDGDTVKFRVNFLPKELVPSLLVRVIGIDTPEKAPRAQCPAEAALALKATEFTKQAVGTAKKVEVTLLGWDKYGGRVLGHILVDGKDLGEQLIAAGLARAYAGDKKKSWCGG
jgi:endonuclease YncB( thermonuclease family)